MEKSKRILIFSLVYYPRHIGGAEVAVKEITDRISDRECVFDMVTMDKTGPRYERIGNVHVYRVGPRLINKNKWFGKTYKYLYIFFAFFTAIRLHRKYHYDATWSIMAGYTGFAALFFKYRFPRVPFLLTLQEGDPIAYIKKRVSIFYPLFVSIFKKADKVHAISHYLAGFAKDMGFQRAPVVIPNGVDIGHFSTEILPDLRESMRQSFGFSKDNIVLVTASRLVKKNGVSDIVSALALLPSTYTLLILGTGELEQDLKLQVEKMDLSSRVVFGGFISHEKLPSYLGASDIFVRPSLSEGLGNAFLEAMAVGIPVIATRVGGIPDFLNHKETGLFCDVENPQSIVEQVHELSDPSLCGHIVVCARNMVRERYDWARIAKDMKNFLIDPLVSK